MQGRLASMTTHNFIPFCKLEECHVMTVRVSAVSLNFNSCSCTARQNEKAGYNKYTRHMQCMKQAPVTSP